jgi:hypothetical protein
VIREKANLIIELAGNRSQLRAAREEAKAHRSKMTGEGTRESGGRAPKTQSTHTSRASMEARFNELKKKRDAEREKSDAPRRVEKDADGCRDGDSTGDTTHGALSAIPPPGRSKDEQADAPPPGFQLWDGDGDGDPLSDSDDDSPPKNSGTQEQAESLATFCPPPPPPAETKPVDLLDLMGEPASKGASNLEDWANFGTGGASDDLLGGDSDLLGGFHAPPQQSAVVDMFADMEFQSASAPTGEPLAHMQPPIFTGGVSAGYSCQTTPLAPSPPSAFAMAPGPTMPAAASISLAASPFDGPWAATTQPASSNADSAATAPSATAAAPTHTPTFLDDVPGELWDLNLKGGALPVR